VTEIYPHRQREDFAPARPDAPQDSRNSLLADFMATDEPAASRKLSPEKPVKTAADEALLDNIEQAHFNYFRDESDPVTGLTRDRSRPDAAASIAAVGFSLTSYPVAVERGWVSRDEAADYTLKVLRTLWNTPQGDAAKGQSGNHGFFYHFLDQKTGTRTWNSELSSIDTALLMSGVLFARDYFKGDTAAETEIRDLADKLYKRVDWPWMLNEQKRLSMGWFPESGFISYDWQGYNEAMILHLLGMGSPTHPLPAETWTNYTATDALRNYGGQEYIDFPPLFGHQYSQSWVDFRGIMDAKNRSLGFDYFENSRRAALAQNYYAIKNPGGFKGYSNLDWGLTACDGPGDSYNRKLPSGKTLEFLSYSARGAPNYIDDGTIAPTAAAASLPFAPELVLPTLRHWRNDRPEIWSREGFKDAFNPSAAPEKPSGWVDEDTLGIDQGPVVLMTENYRSGMVWNIMKQDRYLIDGLKKAGFSGAWLDEASARTGSQSLEPARSTAR
jgi:hypothetical protein